MKNKLLALLEFYENYDGAGKVSTKDLEAWLDKYLTGEQSLLLDDKKIQLADAIIEEANFNGVNINLNTDEIEHQLGTVWVGKESFIQTLKLEA
jgi:hypothetical protein